jgi:hypothetical protein
MSRDRISPLDLVPTDELSAQAFELLRSGRVQDQEFLDTSHYLTCVVGEKQAVVEGTLLIVGADLNEIAEAEVAQAAADPADPDKDPVMEAFGRDRRMFSFLAFTEGIFDADDTRRLRPIGRKIIDHCLLLSKDPEATAALKRIKDSGTQTG